MTNVAKALRAVNAGRKVLGLSPISVLPLGHRSTPRFDPISLAFDGQFTLIDGTIDCQNRDIAARLSEAWDTGRVGDTQVELPAEIENFLRSFSDGQLPEFETNLCSVSGCERTVSMVTGDGPMCDQCAEEWETVAPLLGMARLHPPGPIARRVRTLAMRLIFDVTRFLQSLMSASSRGSSGKQEPPLPRGDQTDRPRSSDAAASSRRTLHLRVENPLS